MNKLLKVSVICVAVLVGLPTVTLATTTIVNALASASENSELENYGQLVEVDGRNMNVVISGDGPQTIVLLPGLGTASPALDFSPLVAELQDEFRVVVVEPFGYGLSEETSADRTAANIAGEVHEALQQLGIDRYVLAGHSIAGIYGLEYVSRFRDEVAAFVGIDTSLPTQPGADEATPLEGVAELKQLGLLRALTALTPGQYDGLSAYDDATRRQLAILGNRNAMTATMINEVEHTPENFAAARDLSFPADLPLLMFVVADDPEVSGWVRLHEEQVAPSGGEVVALTGDHYLHHTRSTEIAAGITEFLRP